jgi:hypothetical protein
MAARLAGPSGRLGAPTVMAWPWLRLRAPRSLVSSIPERTWCRPPARARSGTPREGTDRLPPTRWLAAAGDSGSFAPSLLPGVQPSTRSAEHRRRPRESVPPPGLCGPVAGSGPTHRKSSGRRQPVAGASSAQALTSPATPSLQDRLPGAGGHAVAEPVPPRTPSVVWLERALHCISSRRLVETVAFPATVAVGAAGVAEDGPVATKSCHPGRKELTPASTWPPARPQNLPPPARLGGVECPIP